MDCLQSVVYGNGAWMSGESTAITVEPGVFRLTFVLHAGIEYADTVILGTMTIPGQCFGVASSTNDFVGFDGVLGYASL